MDDADDLRAVQQTLQGDYAAFERIVDRYTPVIYSLAVRYLGREEDAEDAVQDIFLRAYDALGRFRLERRFYSWVYTIAVNHLKNIRGKRTRRGTDNVLPYEDRVATASAQTPLADPEREFARSEGVSLVRDAIDRLPSRYRDVLILRQIEELPVADVSQILDLPEGTVKTHLHRARQALAALIAGIDE
jgi:RNA polymerase sigma-70 factor (ECF subfamily)